MTATNNISQISRPAIEEIQAEEVQAAAILPEDRPDPDGYHLLSLQDRLMNRSSMTTSLSLSRWWLLR